MNEKEKFYSRVFLGGLLLFTLYILGNVLLPFIMGIILAYFFNPIAGKMEKKMPRYIASLIIISTFTLILAIIIAFVVPILFNQLATLLREFTEYFIRVDEVIYQKIADLLHSFGIKNGNGEIKLYFEQFNDDIVRLFGRMLNNLFSSSIALFGLVSALFITPTTAYYFLKDWNKIIKSLRNLFPKSKTKAINRLFRQMDCVLSSYIKGQFSICLLLGVFYAILLSFAGLKSGLFLGIIAGILTIIPYFGAFLGGILGFALAYFQWGFDLTRIFTILGIFALGQFLEGNFVTPNFISNKIQLHPLWIIFALFAGGALAGFWGLFLSLPIVAVVSVTIRFLMKEYKRNGKNR